MTFLARHASCMLTVMAERRTAPRRLARDHGAHDDAAGDGDLLGTVFHDLRDPLSAITMGSRFLVKELPRTGDDAARQAIAKCVRMTEAIQRAAERMNRLVTDYQDLARLEGGRVTLARDLLQALDLLAQAAESAPRAVRVLPVEASLSIRGDRPRVLQALAKLVANALDAEARAPPANAGVVLDATLEGSFVRFAVRDHGGGVDPAVLDHLFDHHWLAARPARSGAGLGLAIARGLVEAQGGALSIESDEGKGTTASFTLPRA